MVAGAETIIVLYETTRPGNGHQNYVPVNNLEYCRSGKFQWLVRNWVLLAALITGTPVSAQEVKVAVAANFKVTAQTLASEFPLKSLYPVVLIPGSTGKLFAQIRNGAPFDVLLAADADRPALLEEQGLAVGGSRFTYAIGRLALWKPRSTNNQLEASAIVQGDFRFLAIANPELAPYGQAARDLLEGLSLWTQLQNQLVRGENIGQAYQFVATGNAELGLVAWSQLKQSGEPDPGTYWLVPGDLHEPIAQQAILVRPSAGGQAFLDYMQSARAKGIMISHGYLIP